MKSRLLSSEKTRTFLLVFETNDEVMTQLTAFAAEHRLKFCHFTGIGGFKDVKFGYYKWGTKDYIIYEVKEQVEVISLIGNIADFEGKPRIHAHVSIGKSDGTSWGGHLFEAHVRPTLEIVVTEHPPQVTRKMNPEAKLPILSL